MSNFISALCAVNVVASVFIGIGALIVGLTGGYWATYVINTKKMAKGRQNAVKILEEAYAEAKTVKKEAILEAKEEIQKQKLEFDQEVKEKRLELQKTEDRLTQKEEFIDKKDLNLDKKQEEIESQKKCVDEKLAKVNEELVKQEEIKQEMILQLEKVATLKKEDAKQILINSMVDDAKKEAAKVVKQIEDEAVEQANKKAQNIVGLAIQKCATDVVGEITISSVSIPNDEMKGRIIGREGRNIRAIENATGVDLIIDDTPETITVSCFDPIRREIARLSLEKLILDGRIHPTRIEEIVEKVQRDVDQTIKQAGEQAVNEAGIFGMHSELVKILGKLKYRTSYGQNVLKHSLETCYIAGLLASEVGANVQVAKRGGLLHDIGKALDHEIEGTHVAIGVDLAKKYKESPEVIHCIEAHHFDVEFHSIEAILVQVADAISSSRPGARRETLDAYVKRLEKLEEISNSFKGVEKSFAVQAGREVRIIVKPEEISDTDAMFLAKDIAKKIESEMEYPGQIKVNVIREARFAEFAK